MINRRKLTGMLLASAAAAVAAPAMALNEPTAATPVAMTDWPSRAILGWLDTSKKYRVARYPAKGGSPVKFVVWDWRGEQRTFVWNPRTETVRRWISDDLVFVQHPTGLNYHIGGLTMAGRPS